MRNYVWVIAFVVLAFCVSVNTSAYGQTESSDGWEFMIAPYAWIERE